MNIPIWYCGNCGDIHKVLKAVSIANDDIYEEMKCQNCKSEVTERTDTEGNIIYTTAEAIEENEQYYNENENYYNFSYLA